MTDHLIPSVEDAASLHRFGAHLMDDRDTSCACNYKCSWCYSLAKWTENAALALDMALAQASDRRRAADDELRRTVAW